MTDPRMIQEFNRARVFDILSGRRPSSGGRPLVPRLLATLGALALATSASATTLTITPDASVYQVGETITLSVLGDPEGVQTNVIFGQILFDPSFAGFVGSHQEQLTFFNGAVAWFVGPLGGGSGFADAFHQIAGSPLGADVPLVATVTLLAAAPGTLNYAWQTQGGFTNLRFFGLTDAPGGSVAVDQAAPSFVMTAHPSSGNSSKLVTLWVFGSYLRPASVRASSHQSARTLRDDQIGIGAATRAFWVPWPCIRSRPRNADCQMLVAPTGTSALSGRSTLNSYSEFCGE